MGSVGDVDGDGLNDFFIGAQNYTSGTGTTYLILGALWGFLEIIIFPMWGLQLQRCSAR